MSEVPPILALTSRVKEQSADTAATEITHLAQNQHIANLLGPVPHVIISA